MKEAERISDGAPPQASFLHVLAGEDAGAQAQEGPAEVFLAAVPPAAFALRCGPVDRDVVLKLIVGLKGL
jgi:hypothetical protein